jgi:hypothetical protein
LIDRLFHFAGFRKAMHLMFREHQLATDADVEYTVFATNQRRLDTKALFE